MLLCAAAAAFVAVTGGRASGDLSAGAPPAARVHIERDGLRYEFDAISGRERLTSLDHPETDLIHARPVDALRLRRALEADIGQPLERLIDANRETIDALKRMGYL